MGADQYSQQVSAHQASMYAAYLGSLSAAGIDPAKATNGVVNAATAVQASAAMILVGVVAAVLV
jgi:hypothetical protein